MAKIDVKKERISYYKMITGFCTVLALGIFNYIVYVDMPEKMQWTYLGIFFIITAISIFFGKKLFTSINQLDQV